MLVKQMQRIRGRHSGHYSLHAGPRLVARSIVAFEHVRREQKRMPPAGNLAMDTEGFRPPTGERSNLVGRPNAVIRGRNARTSRNGAAVTPFLPFVRRHRSYTGPVRAPDNPTILPVPDVARYDEVSLFGRAKTVTGCCPEYALTLQ